MRELDAELDLLVFGNKSALLPSYYLGQSHTDFCRVDDNGYKIFLQDSNGLEDHVPHYSTRWYGAELIYKAMAELVTDKTTPLSLNLGQFFSGKVYTCRFEFAFAQADTPEMAIALCAKNYYTKVRNG